MFRLRNFQIILLICSAMVCSCIPEPIEVNNIPRASDRVVVSNIWRQDVGVGIVLTKNFSALQDGVNPTNDVVNELLISGAEVTLTNLENNQIINFSNNQSGIYLANGLTSNVGDQYRLTIRHDNFESEFEAITQVMPLKNFESLETKFLISFDNVVPQIKFSMIDIKDEDNFYMINVQRVPEDFDESRLSETSYFLEELLSFSNFTFLIDDQDYEGEKIEDEFLIIFNDSYEVNDQLLISISEIEREFYNYLSKRIQSGQSIDLISEPFNLPSNVSNGFGYFSMHQSTAYLRRLDKEVDKE